MSNAAIVSVDGKELDVGVPDGGLGLLGCWLNLNTKESLDQTEKASQYIGQLKILADLVL